MINNNYYFTCLNADRQQIYRSILSGMTVYSDKIKIPQKPMNEIKLIFDSVIMDNPIIFCASTFSVSAGAGGKCFFQPKYKSPKAYVKENTRKIQDYLSIFDTVKSKSDIDKIYHVHDYCLEHFKYDYTFSEHAYTPLGLVLNGTAVCEGIAKFVKLALDYLDVRSLVVTGKAKNPEHERSENHAWNIAKIGGKTYHLDVTFDMTLKDKTNRYDYFCICDDDIKKGHSFGGNVPICNDQNGDYFTANSLLAKNQAELSAIIARKLKRGEKNIMVKLANVKNTENITDKVFDIAQKQYEKLFNSSFSTSISPNIAQCVFEINFS